MHSDKVLWACADDFFKGYVCTFVSCLFIGTIYLSQALDKMISDEKPKLDDLVNKANTLHENCGNKEVLNKAEKAKKDYDSLSAKLQVCSII